jgi:Sybindin-like family
MAFLLFIVSKSGSTVYFKGLRDDAPKIDTNDELRVGSTFLALHHMSAQVSLVPGPTGSKSGGIEEVQAESFKMRCFQSPTGMKFVLFADPQVCSNFSFPRKKKQPLWFGRLPHVSAPFLPFRFRRRAPRCFRC